ncbi:hypothetical protein AMS68_001404 [Peltaster fructicola]|uniref:Dipeptidyl-peptidase V n=1 Tax=Peltaster fructicola TaxID=286661 RepID=A0A6H0XMA7_9PEZI|nr:hypothetical protein AMS68_001404 [Peltaster fructicola]
MVLKATKFTPEVLLGSPRRSAGVPNPSGTLVVFTVSTYSFEKHAKSSEVRLLEVKSGSSWVLSQDHNIAAFRWLDDDQFVALHGNRDGTTELYWHSAEASIHRCELNKSHYSIASIAAPAANLRIARVADAGYAVVVSAECSPDGSLYNETAAKPLRSTAKLYDSLYVRHWDRYETKEKNALWYGRLTKKDGRFHLSKLTNALKNTPLECPIRPFGGLDHFDVSHNRIIFVARDPAQNVALSTKSNLYILTIDSWEQPPSSIEGIYIGDGAKTSPVFSPDGKRAAFLAMKINGYESDQNRIYVMLDIKVMSTIEPLSGSEDHSFWELSPQSLSWTADGKALLTTIEDKGHAKLFYLPLPGEPDALKPKVLTQYGSVSAFNSLSNGDVFTSGSSLIDSSVYQIISTEHAADDSAKPVWTDSLSNDGHKFGLRKEQVFSIWTPANNPTINKHVHSWVFRPSNFDETKKYPVAYLIHGGPQAAWLDSWSTRWNPAVFAEQGYIVVAPNPTGSTGYGQRFTDAINKNWGGDPYEDIVKVFEWVGENIAGADNGRAVALGGSYGGYMANWIQGHGLGRKLKALVNHDGIFSTAGMLAMDELFFPFFDLGGTPFYDPHNDLSKKDLQKYRLAMYQDWKQWDPAEHLTKWETPELVIHSAKDFRIPIADGLATYNVLQARGVASQFLTFPDENHWVLKPENSLVWHKTVLNWINKYVGLPPYTSEETHSDAFFGGREDGKTDQSDMPTQGVPAI